MLDAAYKDIKPIYAKSSIDATNIEELFSAIDIGQLIGSFGSRSADKIDELRRSIVVFTYRTIEETIEIPFREQRIGVPRAYDKLTSLVRKRIAYIGCGAGRDSRLARQNPSPPRASLSSQKE